MIFISTLKIKIQLIGLNNAFDGMKPESAHLRDNADIITQINLNKMMESRTNFMLETEFEKE
jgi:hypothetical protein